MSDTKYINKYENENAYNSDASARATLGKSTVSMEADTRKLHFDGVNVEVPRKSVRVGTAVYADGNGNLHFVDGATVKSASIPSGWEFVGVVSLRKGGKALVLHKNENTGIRFTSCWAWEITGVVYGSSNTIQFQQRKSTGTNTFAMVDIGSALVFTPTDIDDAVSKIDTHLKASGNAGGKSYDSNIVANYNWHCEKLDGRIWVIADFDSSPSYRQYEVGVVKNTAVANGPISNNNMWTLVGMASNYNSIRRNDGVNSNYFSIWNKDVVRVKASNQGSPVDQVAHDGYYSETNFNNTSVLKAYYGTYDKYLDDLMPKYPVNGGAMKAYAGKGAETCAIAESVVYTKRDGVTTDYMFTAIHYTKTLKAHSTASVDGMNAGDWYMPGLDEIVDIFSQMKVDGSDPIHQAFANAGMSSAYPINPSSNVYRWVPARFNFYNAWFLHSTGYVNGTSFNGSYRACGVALLAL
jgi:hypothetical protein